jgi:two-component system, NtrC family, response regulator AtoC
VSFRDGPVDANMACASAVADPPHRVRPTGPDITRPLEGPPDESLQTRRVIVLGDADVIVHPLPEQGTVSIGRAEGMDLRIDRDSISRRHAILHVRPDAIEVEDLGSVNGTKVGGQRIDPGTRVAVVAGDLVEVGATSLLVQGPPSVQRGSPGLERLREVATRVARSELSVLLTGETGVGKEVMARRIHEMSPRAAAPFLALNCGALSEELLASELFGHEQGAFTGATQSKPGLLEVADGGTVFFDEIGEMPMTQQVKLLRVLEERRVMRVGGVTSRPIDVRVLAATHRELQAEVAAGRFRQDLYYRLNGITLRISPLRERVAEIEGLAREFARAAAERHGEARVPAITPEALAALERHPWPGNIRELKNTIERAVVLCGDDPIGPVHLFEDGTELASEPRPDDERGRILAALQQCAGNQTRAAELLGISRKTLGFWMDRHGIARPQKSRK